MPYRDDLLATVEPAAQLLLCMIRYAVIINMGCGGQAYPGRGPELRVQPRLFSCRSLGPRSRFPQLRVQGLLNVLPPPVP